MSESETSDEVITVTMVGSMFARFAEWAAEQRLDLVAIPHSEPREYLIIPHDVPAPSQMTIRPDSS